MMSEAYCWDDRTGLVYHGWKDLTFDGCTIEAATPPASTSPTTACSPAATRPRHASSGVLITGCTFLGARKDESYGHGGLPIVYECPTGMVIRDNTFYASPHEAIGGSKTLKDTSAPALLIEGNTFDMTTQPGRPDPSRRASRSSASSATAVASLGNTLPLRRRLGRAHQGRAAARSSPPPATWCRATPSPTPAPPGGESTIKLADDYGLGCLDNRITANTITNRGAGRAGVICQSSGTGTNYATDNVIDCGSVVPFLVRSGAIVQSGNIIE